MLRSLRHALNAEMNMLFIGSQAFLVNMQESDERELWSISSAQAVLTHGAEVFDLLAHISGENLVNVDSMIFHLNGFVRDMFTMVCVSEVDGYV